MKDNFLSEGFSDEYMESAPMAAHKPGMRHSIRPRKMVGLRAQKRIEELRNAATPVAEAPAKSKAMRQLDAVAKAPLILEEKDVVEPAVPTVPEAIEEIAVEAAPERPTMPSWDDLPLATSGRRRALTSAMPVVDASRDSAAARAFDLLRTRMRQTTRENGWVNIAIASPTSGCGNTFTSVNLALSLSRIYGSRTVLMDMNLRNPGVASAFDMQAPGAMGEYLAGQVGMTDQLVRVSDTLALGLSDQPDENAAEILQDLNTAHTLDQMHAALKPELVIYDMPAMLAHDDVSAFLPQLDAVLLVSDGTKTMGRQLVECERMLEGKVPLLGVVLNRARSSSIQRYA